MSTDTGYRMHQIGRQRGQALIYGIFFMLAGLATLFFMFNTGQLVAEKTKLVNTADAVAYSAGVMHARALNFASYTNRAMMANEVTVAQMISIASWVQYAQGHLDAVSPLNCSSIYSVPAALSLAKYLPLCSALSYPAAASLVDFTQRAIDEAVPGWTLASEAAKANLQLSQATMFGTLLPARARVMQQVADANYRDDGNVKVDAIPLTDNWSLFDGAPFLQHYSGADRTRFRSAEIDAAYKDDFVEKRNWSDHSPWAPAICVPPSGTAERTGATMLNGFEEWRATDSASLRIETLEGIIPRCETTAAYGLGHGTRVANRNESRWYYSGVPRFFDLSDVARAYNPGNADQHKREPHLRFAIRLTRANTEMKTSAGRSDIKPAGRLDLYHGSEAGGVMAAVSTSEVFFDRPVARAPAQTELASTFNPYWQVRLAGNSAAVLAAAVALQSGAPQ